MSKTQTTQEAFDAALVAACQLAGYRTPDLAAEVIKRGDDSTVDERRMMRRLWALINVARGTALDEATKAAEDAGCGCARPDDCEHQDAASRIARDIRALPRKVAP